MKYLLLTKYQNLIYIILWMVRVINIQMNVYEKQYIFSEFDGELFVENISKYVYESWLIYTFSEFDAKLFVDNVT